MRMTRKSSILLVYLLLVMLFASPSSARRVYTDTLPKDGYADTIEVHGVLNPESAILQIAKGEYDLGMFAFNANKYLGLGNDVLAKLNLYKRASSSVELSINPYKDPNKDAPIVTAGDKVYFNPFAIKQVRFALNYLINREYIVQNIYQGSGAAALSGITPSDPAAKYFTPVYDALHLTGSGNEELALKLIANAMDEAAKQVAKYGHTLEKKGGTWYFDGQPVTIKFIIRIEDERKDIGLYISDLLEKKVGFKVDRMLLDRRKASEIVFGKPISTYEWNLYTGGWITGSIKSKYLDWQIYYWYSPLGYYPNFNDPRHQPDVTVEDALRYIGEGSVTAGLQKLETKYYTSEESLGPILKWTTKEIGYIILNGQYTDSTTGSTIVLSNADQYWDLQKVGILVGIMDSVRIFLVETWEFYPGNKARVSKILSDDSIGIASRWSIMTAETPDKHLKIVQNTPTGAMFMSAFNPISGITDINSALIWDLIHDPGGTTSFDGVYVPYRCKWELERGHFTVPDDAVIYNQTQGWIAENAGKDAAVKVKVTCDFGQWHNGVKGNIDDLKYYIAFLYTWAYKDTPNDQYYDASLSNFATTYKTYLGFQFTDNGYVVYGTYVPSFADDLTASNYILYPQLPWELYWAMGELVANAKQYGIDKTYSFSSGSENDYWLDLLNKQHVGDLSKVLDYAATYGRFKTSFPGLPLNSLKNRAEADLSFMDTYGHLAISNGPYRLVEYSPENRYLKLVKVTKEEEADGATSGAVTTTTTSPHTSTETKATTTSPSPSTTSPSPTLSNSETSSSETTKLLQGESLPASTGQTGWANPTYLIAALVGLIAVGGVAAKARGGKSKPSSSMEAAAKPAPTPARKPESKQYAPPKNVPYFPPELLDKYEPLEFLGEGGFAKVFKVRRKSDGKIIALKVSRLDEKAKRFFLKEVKAWRLLDHPNIVKLYNAFDEPLPHLEIEFVDGIQLDGEVIRDLGKYPKPTGEETALALVRGIAEGLKHAHSKQVYHRDLKPQNVLITGDLTPKITDWGLAKVGAVSTTATTTKGLTLLYAAPEQLDDETYGHTDQRTDIYQLGLIFYELLTGRLPYQGTSPAVVMAKVINPAVKPKPPSHFNKALAKYDGIFEKLLAKEKEQRYPSVEEFLRDLELMKKLDEERKTLEEEIEKTKTTMSLTTDSRELKKLMRQLVKQLSRNALLHAQLNDKAGLINALEDIKAFSREHRNELENAISQFEVMMRESVPISKATLDELRVLLHKVQREVEER
ncbi:protein kinase [Thermococcus sp. 21S7]|uniref:protein kinase domain-containing protein n=1 Tax=Thermococcus sp. 21S7 TaxID=1638221 RepID=UPI001F0F78CE|nr:protein kinase [Thermococcus sp. 21S7]